MKLTSLNLWIVLITTITVDLTTSSIIDLSHDHTTTTYMNPGSAYYNRTIVFKGNWKPGVYVEMYSYTVGEHGGTHIDAPIHFTKGGKSLSEIPLEDTILEGVMIDCSEEAAKNNIYGVTVKKLMDWEKVNGKIPDRAGVLFNFNWSSKYTDPKLYLNTNNLEDMNTYRIPFITKEAGDWMVSQRNVKAVGTDTVSPDNLDSDFPVHRRLLGDNRLIVENMKDVNRLPPRNFRFHFSPAKFVGATGSQIRAYAMTYDPVNGGTRIGGWCVVPVLGLALVFILSLIETKG